MQEYLFDYEYETTNKIAYQDRRPLPCAETVYKPKPPKERKTFTPLCDNHTLTKRMNLVPFSLFHSPKPLIRTDPRDVRQPYLPPSSGEDLAQVIATRPRVVMTPAVAIDDVEPTKRTVLIKNMYTTEKMAAWAASGVTVPENKVVAFSGVPSTEKREAPKDIDLLEEPRVIETQRTWGDMSFATPAVRAILLNVTYPRLRGLAEKERVKEVPPAPANPFALPAWRPARVSPEWRMRSASWDRGALRADCNHTQMFWTRPRRTDVWKRTADEI